MLRLASSRLPGSEIIPANQVAVVQKNRAPLNEVKLRVKKSMQQFRIENWMLSDHVCVGRWLAEDGNSFGAPGGSYSWGVWWRDQNFGAYRIHDTFGNLVAHRLDILKEVQIRDIDGNCSVQYTDLVVDLWLWPSAAGNSNVEVVVEDLDEFEAYRESNDISTVDTELVRATLANILSSPHSIINKIDSAIEAAKQH